MTADGDRPLEERIRVADIGFPWKEPDRPKSLVSQWLEIRQPRSIRGVRKSTTQSEKVAQILNFGSTQSLTQAET